MAQDTSVFGLLLRFATILLRRKRPILLFTGIVTLVTVAIVFIVDDTFKAKALIKPPKGEGSSSIDALLKESGGGMAGLLGSFMGGSEQGQNACMSVLNSVRFSKLVIDKFQLETVYKFKLPGKTKKYYQADVIKELGKNAEFEITDEGAIEIAVKDKSAERAQAMVDYMIHVLDSIYTDIQHTESRARLTYIDHRLAMAESDMKRLEDSLEVFENRHNLYLPELQVQFILENATQTELQIEKMKEDMALEAALRGTTSSRYRDLGVEKNLMQKSLEQKLKSHSTDSNTLVLPAKMLPALAMEYFRLDRAYKVKLGRYKYLVQQVEALKLDADKNINVISVLDPAWTSDKRVSPKRRILVEAAFVVSLLLSCAAAVLLEMWEKYMLANPSSLKVVQEIRSRAFRL